MAFGIFVLYLIDVGRLTAADVGICFAIGNGGLLIGALLSRRLTQRLGVGLTMELAVAVFGPSMLVFALAPPALAGPAFAFALFVNTIGIAVHNVSQVTVRQLLTPDHYRARVAAVQRLVIFGALPVGTVLGGLVGEAFGLRAALLASAVGLTLGSLPYLLTRVARIRTVEQLSAISS